MINSLPKQQIVLILSPDLSQSIAIARLLRKHRPDIHLTAGILEGEKLYNTKLYHEAKTIDLNSPDSFDDMVVIPTGAIGTANFSKVKHQFQVNEIKFTDENMRVGDKNWMLDFAKDLSVPVPETWLQFKDLPNNENPVFYKPQHEAGGNLRRMASNKDAIPNQARGHDYLFQEYINSLGTYGVGFIAQNGKVLCFQQHFEKRSDPKDGGSASIIEVFNDARLVDYSKRLIEKLDYSGWGLVEFKYCPVRDDFVLMEINAKFWASLEFSLRQQPCFAKLLFGIESQKATYQGLIWPVRLLASGFIPLVSSIFDLIRYPWIIESNSTRFLIARWMPNRMKKAVKKFIR